MSDEERLAAVRQQLMATGEWMAPLIEAAEGQRSAMERRGWSKPAAEKAALEILLGLIRSAMRPVSS